MADIQRDLMYLKARFPGLTPFLENVDEEGAESLVEKIDGIVSRLASDQEQSLEVLERAQDLQAHWDAIKEKIKPHAKVDTSALVEDVKQIGHALLSSPSASPEPTSIGSEDDVSSLEQSLSSDTEPSAEEEVLEVEISARYETIQEDSPKLIKAFRHVLKQAKAGAFSPKIQEFLDESAPEITELRPLLRAMLLEIIDNPELAPECMGDLKELDELKTLLPDDAEARSELKEAAILGEFPKEYEALEKELNRLTSLYGSQDNGQLEKDFKDISRVLFPELILGAIVQRAVEPPEGVLGTEAINAWLEGIEDPENITEISIRYAELTAYPEALSRFPNLRRLDLCSNAVDLTSFPKVSDHWPHLKTLDLSGNKLTTLPESATSWGHLETLNLRGNDFESLPSLVGSWTGLKQLDLGNCYLTALPDEVGNWSSLEYLSIAGNKLTALPKAVSGWTQLEKLLAANNRFQTLPDEAGDWSHLIHLSLWDNRLTTLPPSIGDCHNLNRLDVSANPDLVLPKEILQPGREFRFIIIGYPALFDADSDTESE